MSDELEYFTEFLENPSAPELNEFFRMLHLWCEYIAAHKNEFNYLEDDDWKEIRERLLDEMDTRMDIKDDLCDEFDEINENCERMDGENSPVALKHFNRRLQFMKSYKHVFRIPDETIIDFEKRVKDFSEGLNALYFAELELRGIEYEKEEAIAELDEILADIYERTGKTLALPRYSAKKVYKGN